MRGLVAILILLLAGCSESPIGTPPGTADAEHSAWDGSEDEPDAGGVEPDAGEVEPDAGEVEPDAGEVEPDAGETEPDAGETEPDAGLACLLDEDCESPASCIEDECVCPIDGCEAVNDCSEEAIAEFGCQACLLACQEAYELLDREKAQLEEIAEAFRSFRRDTGGWPFLTGDWNPDNPVHALRGGVDPTPFFWNDVALFSQGNYELCSEATPLLSCWNGPYLTPGQNFVSAPWLDVWGKVRLFMIIAPMPLPGYHGSVPDGVVVVWSRGPNRKDDAGCTDTNCAQNKLALAEGLPSRPGGDDVIVVVGPSR